jgi:hypothetical protein
MTSTEALLPQFAELFWANVNKEDNCWEWQGYLMESGYGNVTIASRTLLAHRVSYVLTHGSIPPHLVIDHICHNRTCVNPSHLRAVTQKQNVENRGCLNSNNVTGIRGVSWHKASRKWRAFVRHNGRQIQIGVFADIAAAESAVIAKRLELFTHSDMDRDTPGIKK